MKAWKRIEPTTVTKVGWRSIVTKTFINNAGKTVTFDTTGPEEQEFASVIALTPDKQVVVARQFRPGPEIVMNELPAGFIDPGESAEAAVIRELEEETGYKIGSIEYLGRTPKDAYMNGLWHGFLATDCTPNGVINPSADEEVEVALMSIDELITSAKNGLLTDPAVILMAYDKLQEVQNA